MSDLAATARSSLWKSGAKRFVQRRLALLLRRLDWVEHPDTEDSRQAAYRLREKFLEDWESR